MHGEVPMALTIHDIWQIILAVCGGITVILGAAGAVYRVVIKAKEPTTKLITRVDDCEKRIAEHDVYLKKDKDSIEAINEGHRVTQKALLAIIEQLLTGGSTDSLRDAKNELQAFLINK